MGTVVYIAVDADGVVFNTPFHSRRTSLSQTPNILASNERLIDHIVSKIKNATADYSRIKVGSFRQSHSLDKHNSTRNKTGPFFVGISILVSKIKERLSLAQVKTDFDLDSYLLSDKGISDGFSFANSNLAVYKDFYGFDPSLQHPEWEMPDDGKASIVYAHMHRAVSLHPGKKIIYELIDDRKDILDALISFFRRHPDFIPPNVTLQLTHYREERAQPNLSPHASLNFLPRDLRTQLASVSAGPVSADLSIQLAAYYSGRSSRHRSQTSVVSAPLQPAASASVPVPSNEASSPLESNPNVFMETYELIADENNIEDRNYEENSHILARKIVFDKTIGYVETANFSQFNEERKLNASRKPNEETKRVKKLQLEMEFKYVSLGVLGVKLKNKINNESLKNFLKLILELRKICDSLRAAVIYSDNNNDIVYEYTLMHGTLDLLDKYLNKLVDGRDENISDIFLEMAQLLRSKRDICFKGIDLLTSLSEFMQTGTVSPPEPVSPHSPLSPLSPLSPIILDLNLPMPPADLRALLASQLKSP